MGNAAWNRFVEAVDKLPRRVEAEGKIRWYEDGVLVREVDAAMHYGQMISAGPIVEAGPPEIPEEVKRFLLG